MPMCELHRYGYRLGQCGTRANGGYTYFDVTQYVQS